MSDEEYERMRAQHEDLRRFVEGGIARRRAIMATWPAALNDQPKDMGFWAWMWWTIRKARR